MELHAIASVEQGSDLGLLGHRVGAQQARGDDRAGAVGESHALGRRPAGQQAVAERAAERVAGAEAADDRHAQPRHELALVRRGDEHALAALLDDGQPAAAREQRVGRASEDRRVPTATRHSSRLPTAVPANASAPPMIALASASSRQNVGR